MKPIPQHFTEVIAERRFEIARGTSSRPVLIEIGKPIQDVETVEGMDWRCPVRLTDGARTDVKSAYGVDSFQALSLATERMVPVMLKGVMSKSDSVRFLGEPYDLVLVKDTPSGSSNAPTNK